MTTFFEFRDFIINKSYNYARQTSICPTKLILGIEDYYFLRDSLAKLADGGLTHYFCCEGNEEWFMGMLIKRTQHKRYIGFN